MGHWGCIAGFFRLFWALSLAVPDVASAADREDIPFPVPEGVTTRGEPAPHGRYRFEVLDSANDRRLVTVADPMGRLESMEEYTLAGRLLDRREFHSLRFFHETFPRPGLGVHTKVWVGRSDRRGFQKVTEWRKEGNAPAFERTYLQREADALSCPPPPAVADPDAALAAINWAHIAPQAQAGDWVPLGYNFRAAPSCAAVSGGINAVAERLRSAMRTAVSCLRALGGDRATDAARLLTLMNAQPPWHQPVSFYCGAPGTVVAHEADGRPITVSSGENARAHDCTAPSFPALHLNTASAPNAGTIAHEMMHLLGYRHSTGVDIAYLTQICCFDPGSRHPERNPNTNDACNLARMNVNDPLWGRYDAGRRFAILMADDRRPFIARQAALQSAISDSEHRTGALLGYVMVDPPDRDSSQTAAQWREGGYALRSLVLGVTALSGVSGEGRARAQEAYFARFSSNFPTDAESSSFNRFVASMGMAISHAIGNNRASFEASMHDMRTNRSSACALMNPAEKAKLRELAGELLVRVMDVVPPSGSAGAVWDQWQAPCP